MEDIKDIDELEKYFNLIEKKELKLKGSRKIPYNHLLDEVIDDLRDIYIKETKK